MEPIDTHMMFESSPLEQTKNCEVIQLDPNADEENLDLLVKIYHFDPEPRSLLMITFLYPPSSSSLRVLITKDYRPSFHTIISRHQVINEQSPTYYLRDLGSESETRSFYYIVILPGTEVSVNKSIEFSFTMNNIVCQTWSRVKWSSAGCLVGNNTKGNNVHCQCTHFSIFLAAAPYLPNEIDPFSDAKLFLTVFENPLAITVILISLILYLVLSVWAYRMDKKDQFRGAVTVLEDNCPGDSNAYLLVVCTSSRALAGTSANVAVTLDGEKASSRTHILKSRYYQVLARNSDDWFLLFTQKPLGLIKMIHIWHDNSGFAPGWYCNNIHVYDLQENMETLFIVDEWLSLSLTTYPEATLLPATPSDILNTRRLFFSNFVNGLREKESLTGVFTKHPRSLTTRFQLLNVNLCMIMLTLLLGIMFYHDPDDSSDDYAYDVTIREFVISITTGIVSAAVRIIIIWNFKKSYKIAHRHGNLNALYLRKGQFEDYFYDQLCRSTSFLQHSSALTMKKSVKGSFVYKFKKYIGLTPKSLAPASLIGGKPVIEVVKIWLIIAWVSSVVITLVCIYITALYGLKLGIVKSKKWFTSSSLSVVEDSFFLSPLTAVTIAMFLAATFEILLNTTSFQITKNDIIQTLSSSPQSKKHINHLCKKRCLHMYSPLPKNIKTKYITRDERVNNCIQISQFIISLAFVIVISNLLTNLWSSQYYAHSHLVRVLTAPRFRNIGFFNALNTRDVDKYIETTFLEGLYSSRWYNNKYPYANKSESMDSQLWTSDFTWKMITPPSLRQLRVKPKRCNNIILANNSCIPPWSPGTEDTDIYEVGWLPFKYEKSDEDVSPWKYTCPTLTRFNTMYRLYAPSETIYNDGGFIARLHTSVEETLGTVSQLVDNSWQDYLTRAMFVEVTLWNTNSPFHFLAYITLITEYLISSMTLKDANVYSAVECSSVTPWEIAFLIVVIIFSLELCFKINQEGVFYTLKKFDNLVLLIIVALGIALTVLYCIYFFNCAWYNFQERRNLSVGSYLGYNVLLSYNLTASRLLGFLLITCTYRTLALFKPGIVLAVFYQGLALSLRAIIWLYLILFIYILIIQRGILLTNLTMWTSFLELSMTPNRMIHLSVGHLTIRMLFLVVVKLILVLLMTVFIYNNKIARHNNV